MPRSVKWAQPALALPLGTGPFHVKGVIYLGTQKYFREQVPNGMARLIETLEAPELRAFIDQKFLPSSWYDVLPVAPLIRAEAEVSGLSVPEYMQRRAAFQAREDIRGVYRWLLSLASPETVALKLPRLLTQIFDFGDSVTERVDDHTVHVEVLDFPAVLGEWYATAFQVYAITALELAGGKDVTLVLKPTPQPRHESGLELVKLEGDMIWR
ncbi:MAG: hypothetical protein U0234_15445 [Sandaracinus sp.]